MGFIDQVKHLQVSVSSTPRIYLKWENTEEGRDNTECYERIIIGGSLAMYVSTSNPNIWVAKGDYFWDIFETMYLENKDESK